MTYTQVSVDRDFARFGGKSYAINKINSVEVRQRQPYGQTAMFVWGLLSLMTALLFLGSLGDPSAGGGGIVTLLLAGLFGYLTYRAWVRSKVVEYQLFFMTSSSEAQALASRDGQTIMALRARIESAMSGQLSS